MLRVDKDGNVIIWFELGTATKQKIEWVLSEFIRLSKANSRFLEFKADAINTGTISMLTDREIEELNRSKGDKVELISGVAQAKHGIGVG